MTRHLLLRIIGRIAEDAGEDSALYAIREFDDDAFSICLLEFSFQDELDDRVD